MHRTPPSADGYHRRLAPPRGRPRIVIDTDAANEIDDQFALAWALLSPRQLDVVAVYAAPFSFQHRRAQMGGESRPSPLFDPPGVGMERSHDEILRVFDRLRLSAEGRVFRGSAGYLSRVDSPLPSQAVQHLIKLARATPPAEPLYVVAIGCVTNIACALLLAPDIADRIVVVWTSGYPSHAPHVNDSFNLEQDMLASALLFDSGVPLVYLPGFHVGAQLRLSLPEVERCVQGCGAIGHYLHHLFTHNPLQAFMQIEDFAAHSWVMWDLINVAWLINPAWVPSDIVPTPVLGSDRRWARAEGRHPMREAHAVARDAIFRDLFAKLATAPP